MLSDTFKSARNVSQAAGKSLASQLIEVVRLRFGPQQLGFDDYYLYQLYSDRYSSAQKSEFCGWRLSAKIDRALNDDAWRVYANDKLEFARAMDKAGLLTPRITALYSEQQHQLADSTLLSNPQEAVQYLRDPGIYPLFLKPVHGTYGRGGYAALAIDTATDMIQMGNGALLSPELLAQKFSESWTGGYLMQQLLGPHPEVETVVGQRLSSLRVVVLLTENGPRLFRAVWKLPTGNNMSDNFMHGELGNLIATVNIETGAINNAVGMNHGEIVLVPEHPDTGAALTGLIVPMWHQVSDYCARAAQLFPGLGMQHWDIALTPQGPVALEVNVEGSVDLHQIAGGRGIYDPLLRALLSARHQKRDKP